MLIASDFKDFIDSMQTLYTTSAKFIRDQKDWEGTSTPSYRSKRQCNTAEQRLDIIKRLEKDFQELDSHYGWVLASDHALVARAIAQQAGIEIDAKGWMKKVYKTYVTTRKELSGLKELLCDYVEH